MHRLTFALAMLALVLAGLALYPKTAEEADPVVEEEAHELVYTMGYLQRYAAKLGEAGARQNWELAGFYVHEIEETTEELVEGGYMDDGYDLSALTASILEPAVAHVDAAIDTGEGFETAYEGLVQACNDCHAATDHGFLVIIATPESGFTNQDFAPRP